MSDESAPTRQLRFGRLGAPDFRLGRDESFMVENHHSEA
jgi:hypothetical protein